MRSAHDCSDGAPGVTIAECAFDAGGIGVGGVLEGVAVGARMRAINAAGGAVRRVGDARRHLCRARGGDAPGFCTPSAANVRVGARDIGQTVGKATYRGRREIVIDHVGRRG